MFAFILTFFILAPVLLFYASGYRLDFKRHQIIKTGTLFIEAKDIKKADLYINEKLYAEPFNEKMFIYNLLPGEYTIRLEKTGFHAWQKKAVINSSITSFIKDAILFKNEVPLQLVDGKIINFSISPDWQKIIYVIVNEPFDEFYLYDIATSQKTFLYRTAYQERPIDLAWAPSSKKILTHYDNNYVILDSQNNNNISVKAISDFNPANVIWDNESDNTLFAQYQNAIYKIDLFGKSLEKIYTAKAGKLSPEFLITGKDIFYLLQNESNNILAKYNLQFKTDKKILELGKSSSYKFIQDIKNYLGLIDLDQEKLHLIKMNNSDLETIISSEEPIREFIAKDALWDAQNNQLLLYNDFEISTYQPGTNKEEVINRYGQQIKKTSWYPDFEHLVILFENNLQIIDLTQEIGTRNSINIVKFDKLNNFDLDRNGEKIYFSGDIGRQQGLYQLNLK